MFTKTTTKFATLAAVPLLVALFTACSSDSPSSESTKSSSPGAATQQDWMLAYAKCMRAEGIDQPDPSSDGSITSKIGGDDAATSAASKKCIDKIGEPQTTEGQKRNKQEILDEQLETAKCFRENGLDSPDPTENTGVSIPADAPKDVIKKCVGSDAPAGSQMATVQ